MQYKHKRYSDAIMPRKYDAGSKFISPANGCGNVIECTPEKDVITKEKFGIIQFNMRRKAQILLRRSLEHEHPSAP